MLRSVRASFPRLARENPWAHDCRCRHCRLAEIRGGYKYQNAKTLAATTAAMLAKILASVQFALDSRTRRSEASRASSIGKITYAEKNKYAATALLLINLKIIQKYINKYVCEWMCGTEIMARKCLWQHSTIEDWSQAQPRPKKYKNR